MSRFIAVCHYWFMDSKGFSTQNLSSDNLEDASKEAALIQVNNNNQFKKCAVEVIQIGDNEKLIPRKLTWRERLAGVQQC